MTSRSLRARLFRRPRHAIRRPRQGKLLLGAAAAITVASLSVSALPVGAAPAASAGPTVVVPANGSAALRIASIPADASSVTLRFTATGAWRPTRIRASLDGSSEQRAVMTAQPAGSSADVKFRVPTDSKGELTLWSASASVRVAAVVVSSATTHVIGPGQSTQFPLGAVPAGSTHVRVRVFAEGAWRESVITASAGSTAATVMTAGREGLTRETTVPLDSDREKSVRVSSSSASARVTLRVLGFDSRPSDEVAPPTPARPPVVPSPPVPPVPPVEPAPPSPPAQPDPPVNPAPPAQPVPPVAPAPPVQPAPPIQPLPGIPGPATTGVPAGVALRLHVGDLHISQPGAVIDGLDIRGSVFIEAPNVTIRNSIVRGDPVRPNTLVRAGEGHPGLTIIDSELAPSLPDQNLSAIVGYNFRLVGVDINHVYDAVHIIGDNVSVERSWMHDHTHYDNDPGFGGGPSHDDSIQIQVGKNISIVGNRIEGAYNAGLMITQDRGPVSNVTFSDNFANGGACTINVAEKSHGPVRGMRVIENTFGMDTMHDRCAVIAKPSTKIEMDSNFYTDGTPVTTTRG